ncbi:NepR family anti-sigma factor [Oceanibium sediminis]|uniref:NepR family anti-sigma factor n=1 Tax=Oceanibium sediminis TaxID=2026339 RepID=UPI001300AE02|nr:NepR family anti-sigma factor [Oceanibium sediminis]
MSDRQRDNPADTGAADTGNVQDQIEENLRKLYDETLSEQLPDELLQLLKKLEESDTRK